MPQGGLTDDQQAEIRRLAFETLTRFRDGGSHPAPPPDDDTLLSIMEFAVGGAEMAPYLPLLEEELAYRGEDRRAPAWHVDDVAPGVEFDVLIIGAGMSGILAAHRLQQAGVRFTIVEKDDDVGGTWLENTYPGCRVDNPNHNYSFSFAQRHDWPFHFSPQPVLLDYFQRCADAFGVREHVHFGTEVVEAVWSDDDHRWRVTTRDRNGTEDVVEVHAVISAVGQLNRPLYPDIEGRDTFEGVSFHSARWNHDVDLAGKRVAVIGTGASAVQFIPEIAPLPEQLVVFMRTPPWMGPTPEYHDEVPNGLCWLYG
jgi:4-hydroxyacetophenone monooxygenase